MVAGTARVALTMDEIRVVARYAADCASEVLVLFEQVHPDDRRPRDAVEAALAFADGAARSRLQRVTALDAHRAARDASTEAAKHAAHAAGDAAAAAYLHPLARATQVAHILRAPARAAHAAELAAGGDERVGEQRIEDAVGRAGPTLSGVLRRYPRAPVGRSRVAQLMTTLDAALRSR